MTWSIKGHQFPKIRGEGGQNEFFKIQGGLCCFLDTLNEKKVLFSESGGRLPPSSLPTDAQGGIIYFEEWIWSSFYFQEVKVTENAKK